METILNSILPLCTLRNLANAVAILESMRMHEPLEICGDLLFVRGPKAWIEIFWVII